MSISIILTFFKSDMPKLPSILYFLQCQKLYFLSRYIFHKHKIEMCTDMRWEFMGYSGQFQKLLQCNMQLRFIQCNKQVIYFIPRWLIRRSINLILESIKYRFNLPNLFQQRSPLKSRLLIKWVYQYNNRSRFRWDDSRKFDQ